MVRVLSATVLLGIGTAFAAVLPAGYTEIEYVQSSGKQYVDTGIIGKSGLEFEIDAMPLDTLSDTTCIGSRNNGDTRFYAFALQGNRMRYGYVKQNGNSTIVASPNVRYRGIRTVLHAGEQSISYGGETYSQTDSSTLNTGRSMYIFSNNNAGNSSFPTKIRFYNIKIFEGGTPLANFVPCRRDVDGLLGFYDTVRDRFFENAVPASPLTSEGLVCSADGTSLTIDTGDQTVVCNPVNMTGYMSLGKKGSGTLLLGGDLAQAGVFTFDALKVNEGFFRLPVLPDLSRVVCQTADLGTCTLNFVWDGVGLSSYTVSGKARVNGTVSLTVPTTLPAGTYRLIQAGELELNGGAELVLDESSQTGAGTTVRTLTVDATGVTLTVVGDPMALPEGYAVVPYIKSTGNEWIDTGVEVDESATVEMDFDNLAYAHATALFGQDSWTGSRYLFNQQSNKLMFHGAGTDIATSVSGTARYRILIADDDKAYLTTDGTRAGGVSISRTTAAANKRLAIFGLNNGSRQSSFCFFGMKIYVAGQLVRQFVPVHNEEDELGLYDLVSQTFFGNRGSNQFFTEGGTDVFLKAIDSNGNQHIDSGILANAGIEADLDLLAFNEGNGDSLALGARNNGRFYMFHLANSKCGFGYGNSNSTPFEYEPLKRMRVHSVLHAGEQSLTIDGTVVQTGTDTADVQTGKTLYFFAMRNGDAAGFQSRIRLFGATISRGGVVQGDYVPMRRADGLIGLYDRQNSVFLPNLNPGFPFARYGIAYTLDGNTLCLHDGDLESDDIKSTYTAVRKVSKGVLNAGDQTAFPALSIENGTFSFQNAKAETLTVAGALALSGGARLVLDLTVTGTDCLTASTVDLSGATAATPVALVINPIGVMSMLEGETRPVIAQGLSEGDAAKFVVQGFPATAEVREGALVLVKKDVGAFTWTGNEVSPLWSLANNWNRGLSVESGADLHFDLPSGGAVKNDVSALAVTAVSFGSAAGAFTLNGPETLFVQTGLQNASSSAQTMTLPLVLGVDGLPFTVNTKGSMSLQSGATVQACELVKTGAGELEVDGLALSAPSVTLAEGRIKLLDVNRGAADANAATGTLSIAEGAQFDINFSTELSSGDSRWSSYTAGKEIQLAGSGPDGTGAIVNRGKNAWCSMFTRMTLTDDAVVGGPGRIDLRNAWSGNSYKGRTWMKGPDATFMSKVTCQHGFNFNNSDIAIRKLVVGEQGRLGLEGTTWLDVPEGIEITNGGQLDLYSSTLNGTSTVFVASGSVGSINNYNETSVFNIPVEVQTGGELKLPTGVMTFASNVTVQAGAMLTDNDGSQVMFKGPLAVEGDFAKTAGGKLVLDGPLSGTGRINATSGELTFGNLFSRTGETAPTVNYTGSYLRFGEYSGVVGVPPVLPSFDAMTAEIRFHLVEDAVSDNHALDEVMAKSAVAKKWVRFYTNKRDPIPMLTVKNSIWDVYALGLAAGSEFGALKISEGATLNILDRLSMCDSGTASSRLELEEGGRINILGSLATRVGYSGGQTDVQRHDLIVHGGVFNSSNMVLTVGYNSAHAYVTQKGGQVSVSKLFLRGGDENATKHDECYYQYGGLLEVGADGVVGPWALAKHNGRPQIDMEGGTFRAIKSFNSTYARVQTVFGSDLLNGGQYTFDLNGNAVNWENAIGGASEVTFAGSGSFITPGALQNMMFGAVHVPDGSTAQLDLSGVSGFVGGLDLGASTSATIDIGGESLVEFTILKAKEFASFDAVTNHLGFYAYTVNNMRHLHQSLDSGQVAINQCYYCYRGQFYVPEGQGGTWSFAGNFDDYVRFFIDGEQVLDSVSYLNVGRGSRQLSEGWHDFLVIAYDNTGGQGPQASDWKSYKLGLGFTTDPQLEGSAQARDYTPFDPTTLAMRVRPMVAGRASGYSSMRFRHGLVASSYEAVEPDLIYDEIVWTSEFLDSANVSPLNGQQMYGSNSRFTGYFKVTEDEAGTWKFDGKYDDCLTVKIDGTQMLRTTSWTATGSGSRELAAGWHSFDIRVKDGGGASGNGYGAGLTDSTGARCAVRVSVKGAATKAFNMNNFRMAATAMDAGKFERAGLGGRIRLAEGATLSNKAQAACPIYGTLTGSGALAGQYAFTPQGSWRVKANAGRLCEVADVQNVTSQSFVKNLRKVEVVCTATPANPVYLLCSAGSLTDVEAAEIEVEATVAEGAEDVKVASGWRATVRDGKLLLVNPCPAGTAIFLR